MRQLLRRLLGPADPPQQRLPEVTLRQYLKPDGSFNYQRYRKVQIEGNYQKLNTVWAREENIAFLSAHIKSLMAPRFGICHGTRRGVEQAWFRKYLGCEVIGTEISDTATQFPHTIEWDFHEVKPEWLGAVDFIYSNALDHSYDPEMCLNVWMRCVRSGGICIIEHSTLHETVGANELDPFGASIFLMPYLITKWARSKFFVREILDAPDRSAVQTIGDNAYVSFIVVQNF